MFRIGQRWISEMEPELGLGTVTAADRRVVTIDFPASGCARSFAIESAPLRRVLFRPGDTITLRDGSAFLVLIAEEQNGLMRYSGETVGAGEEMLADTISFNTPRDRLLNLYIDSNSEYLLRYRTLRHRYHYRRSPLRGLLGGRIELIPHQLYVADTVSSRPDPRVLLSDETGLGKTIEAALILHRLLTVGRINRVLVCVPEPLVHQWFVELLRRFNLIFRLYDAEHIESLLALQSGENPFLEEQLVLCSVELLSSCPEWGELAAGAGWDMLVMDEAHHLVDPGAAYDLARALCAASAGVLLITATPEQLGRTSHFSRLRLLDPAKYRDREEFEKEEKEYTRRVAILNKVIAGERLTAREEERLAALAPAWAAREGAGLARRLREDDARREQFVAEVVDRHGTGRAVFRNTRTEISGFPARHVEIIPLAGERSPAGQIPPDFTGDPRLIWLAHYLRQHRRIKVLLICHSPEEAIAIAPALQKLINIKMTLFHEHLSLLQRDRNASWFADADGARLLICSEIGSEGRNFQFCHHLFLFDLPPDPELLEQRIGRLDRIGQSETIEILVPCFTGSGQEVLVRWYHEGLNAFAANLPGAHQIHAALGAELQERIAKPHLAGLDDFISRTRTLREETAAMLQKGQDRLLALNSCRPDKARALQEAIAEMDNANELEKLMLKIFDLYGIIPEEIGKRTWQLNLSLLSQPGFPLPALKREQLVVSFDRRTALNHEEIEFLTWDHPMVTGAIDLMLGREKGNCAVCTLKSLEAKAVLLETVFILECVKHQRTQPDRFLPPTPIRIVTNELLEECSAVWPMQKLSAAARNDPYARLAREESFRLELLPSLLAAAQQQAEQQGLELIHTASERAAAAMDQEIERLHVLSRETGPAEEAIAALRSEKELLLDSLGSARLRLDSLRLIGSVPAAS